MLQTRTMWSSVVLQNGFSIDLLIQCFSIFVALKTSFVCVNLCAAYDQDFASLHRYDGPKFRTKSYGLKFT